MNLRSPAMPVETPAYKRWPWIIALCAASAAALDPSDASARRAGPDRRLGVREVQAIADDLHRAGGLRVIADATVVSELNEIVCDPEARAHFREGLARLEDYRRVGGGALRRRGVPLELLAIAQQESRVQSLPESASRTRSAGIWQFIPATARRYGLRVDGTIDERLDPVRSAEAAAEYLADLQEEFHDWRLTIAAYNAGDVKIKRVIAAESTTDAVLLAKRGAISRYASAVLATALLIHRPELLN